MKRIISVFVYQDITAKNPVVLSSVKYPYLYSYSLRRLQYLPGVGKDTR